MRRRPAIKWLLWRVMAAIGLAGLATWASAWGFAVWEQRSAGAYANPEAPNVWVWTSRVNRFEDPFTSLFKAAMGATQWRIDSSRFGTSLVMLGSGISRPIEVRQWSFGWPLRCLEFTEKGPASYLRGTFSPVRTSTWINGWAMEPMSGWRVVLPIRVRGWEMAGDIGVWGLMIGALLVGVPVARMMLRKRRGCCVACGYDRHSLGSATPCPECGRPG